MYFFFIFNATRFIFLGSAVSRSNSTSSLNSIASITGCLSGVSSVVPVTTGTTASQQPPTPAPTSPLCDSEFRNPLPPLSLRDQQLAASKHQLKRTLLSGN